ncbi:hypothetical protein [Paenibacillus sp. Y412MC10]|uniref:hypothetical protein n=1 Tax=Geobacillus sp. (strain Y412MC10) TaxID=481743 RepID=UPI0011AB2F66|nr:hypothetical protein [Paenibacillus sp. Y412MC10]
MSDLIPNEYVEPEYNAAQMRRLVESDHYLKFVFDDLTKKGNSEESTLEAQFLINVFEDSLYTDEYNKFTEA